MFIAGAARPVGLPCPCNQSAGRPPPPTPQFRCVRRAGGVSVPQIYCAPFLSHRPTSRPTCIRADRVPGPQPEQGHNNSMCEWGREHPGSDRTLSFPGRPSSRRAPVAAAQACAGSRTRCPPTLSSGHVRFYSIWDPFCFVSFSCLILSVHDAATNRGQVRSRQPDGPGCNGSPRVASDIGGLTATTPFAFCFPRRAVAPDQ